MPAISRAETMAVLQTSPDNKVSNLAKDAALVKALTDVFNATLEIAEEFPQTKGELATLVARKSVSVIDFAAGSTGSKSLEYGSMAASQTLKTIGLLRVASLTPTKAAGYITLSVAEKIVLAAGLAEIDKCKMAITSLGLTMGSSTLVCAGSAGIGCVAGAIAVAADAFNVYGQCHGD